MSVNDLISSETTQPVQRKFGITSYTCFKMCAYIHADVLCIYKGKSCPVTCQLGTEERHKYSSTHTRPPRQK